MAESKIILVVCSGNIHRSVIAEHCINRALKARGLDSEFIAVSRGLQGSGKTAMPKFSNIRNYSLEWGYMESILRDLGIDIPETQVATPIDKDIVENASLILAMDEKVLYGFDNCLIAQFPKSGFKMRLFSEMTDEIHDLQDCAGSTDVEKYRQVNLAICSIAKAGMQKMCLLANLLSSAINAENLRGLQMAIFAWCGDETI